jgi:hypothetical protein
MNLIDVNNASNRKKYYIGFINIGKKKQKIKRGVFDVFKELYAYP